MSAEHDHSRHAAPPDPRLEKRLSAEQTQALEERVRKLEALLVAKGLVTTPTLEKLAATYENDIGPMNGARVVAKAWTDPAFKARVLEDGTKVSKEIGIDWAEPTGFGTPSDYMNLRVLEDTPKLHHVIV